MAFEGTTIRLQAGEAIRVIFPDDKALEIKVGPKGPTIVLAEEATRMGGDKVFSGWFQFAFRELTGMAQQELDRQRDEQEDREAAFEEAKTAPPLETAEANEAEPLTQQELEAVNVTDLFDYVDDESS